jgi:hypothetical protein
MSPTRLVAMDLSSHVAAAVLGAVAGAALSETTDPLVKTIGGWASFGSAMMCALEAGRDEPRWDRAAGMGATGGAVFGGAVILYDTFSSWWP